MTLHSPTRSLTRRNPLDVVKWLGEGAVIPLAVDGKVTGDALLRQIRQWCSTKGKGVVTPGSSNLFLERRNIELIVS